MFDLMEMIFGKDPGREANKQLDNIPGVVSDHMQGYADQGRTAGEVVNAETSDMMNDPAAFMDALMKHYKPSEGYKYKQDMMGQAAGNSAAAGGQRGGTAEQSQQQQITQGLLGEDMQGWLNNIMGVHTQGMQGQENTANRGYDADKNITDTLTNMFGTKATADYNSASRPTRFQQGADMAAKTAGAFMGMPTSGGGDWWSNLGGK